MIVFVCDICGHQMIKEHLFHDGVVSEIHSAAKNRDVWVRFSLGFPNDVAKHTHHDSEVRHICKLCASEMMTKLSDSLYREGLQDKKEREGEDEEDNGRYDKQSGEGI